MVVKAPVTVTRPAATPRTATDRSAAGAHGNNAPVVRSNAASRERAKLPNAVSELDTTTVPAGPGVSV